MKRHASVSALAAELDAYVEHRPIAWLDRSPWIRSRLALRRSPLATGLAAAIFLVTIAGALLWSDAEHARRVEALEAANQLRVSELNHRVELEQERVESVKTKAKLVQTMIETWFDIDAVGQDPQAIADDLLFVQILSASEIFKNDPTLVSDLVKKRADAAEKHLASLDPETSSPLQRALWHELLANWLAGSDAAASNQHRQRAQTLVERFAPADRVWLNRIAEGGRQTDDTDNGSARTSEPTAPDLRPSASR